MNKMIDDFEKLSAYLDGELPLSEKNDLEQRLAVSSDLRKKLQEIQKIKEAVRANYKPLPESPYFESRVMANLNSKGNTPLLRRKWIPVFGVILVTAILMIVLKFNPSFINRLVEEQTTNLASFYKENLKPLLYAANLSNEDIFNFAFYKELPLDNDNGQFLQIGHNQNGDEFFEIKKSSYNVQENNYERFVTALNLNDKQKRRVDSMLQHYAAELQQQVLVNDRNTVAINPNLWNYNRAIAADLVAFASEINEPELRKIIPASDRYINTPEILKMVKEIRSNQDQNYIFLTPDTIFTSWIDVDAKELKEEIKLAREEYSRASEQFRDKWKDSQKDIRKHNFIVRFDSLRNAKDKRYKRDHFEVFVNDENCRVVLQGFEPPEIQIPDMDSISAHIERVMRTVQVFTDNSPKNPTKLSKRYNFQYSYPDSVNRIIIPDIRTTDSVLTRNYNYFNQNNQKIDSLMSLYMPNFKFRGDSLTTYFKMYDDSTRYQYEYELQIQLRGIEKEMKKFREEMQNLRKDLNKEKQTDTIKKIRKPIEI